MIQLNFRRFATVAVALVALITVSAMSTLASADSVGTVTIVSGNAMLQRAGTATPVANNEPVMLHDTITTGPGADVGIYMADGSTLSITESSIAEIEDSTMVNGNAVISRVKLIKGRVHAKVPDVAGTPTRRLEIDSANANVVGPAPSYVH